jgi:YidC/Oxa1 family membrane protein insertase
MGFPNYGLAIIFFTITVKLILFPLTNTQMRSMHVMQELQPKIKDLQTKFKDKNKAQQAVMELYKKENVNPTAGCLPLLVQMPILYALFASLRVFFDPKLHPVYVNLAYAKFLWIPNLGKPDLIWLPLLTVVATFFQQYVTSISSTGKIDQTQKSMLFIMPLFIGYMARSFPSGLALYWVVYSLWGIVEMFVIKRMLKAGREQDQLA